MSAILPGGMIGILGGGQLGRMLTLEARRMGYRTCIFDPTPDCPAGQVADFHIRAPFDDRRAAEEFVSLVNVVTIETEHIPLSLLTALEKRTPTYPGSAILGIVQDRLAQREFLSKHSLPQVRYAPVMDEESLHEAAHVVGLPAILKSRRGGYDGKGQVRIDHCSALVDAWEQLGKVPAVLESVAPFRMELSVILARNAQGQVRLYPVAENVHHQHILRTTRAPARIPSAIRLRAEMIALAIARQLHYCGVLAIELFLLRDASLLVNEIAPRVHNSGHYTLGACATSQFEQQLRAICGVPLGDPTLLRPAVMLNLLGDLWQQGPPDWEKVFAQSQAQLHLYGKTEARAGRKMGHVLFLDEDTDRALQAASALFPAREAINARQEAGAEWKSSSYPDRGTSPPVHIPALFPMPPSRPLLCERSAFTSQSPSPRNDTCLFST